MFSLLLYAYLYCVLVLSALEVIQVLRNAVGDGGVSDFLENSVTVVYGSTLLAL